MCLLQFLGVGAFCVSEVNKYKRNNKYNYNL